MIEKQAGTYQWVPYVETMEMGGEWVVMHAENYTTTTLNETGGYIWSLLRQPQSVRQLAEHVAQRFQVSKLQAQVDVESFLDKLMAASLIEEITA